MAKAATPQNQATGDPKGADKGSTAARPKTKSKAKRDAELEAERRRAQEYEDKYKRALADYVNLERRTSSDIQNGINQKTDPLLRDFLDIYDDFVRARDSYRSGGADTAGLDSIIRNAEAMFKRNGVDAIESEGRPFDPRLHEAMLTREEPDMDEHTVVRELRKGYITHGRVVRPALVEISTKGGAD